ncbi:MAG: hypothetical protein K9M07_06245 [Simkaniaceae bacterium]|nr:hypothetical protein [Simkaniaceae bacterium]
MASAFPSRLHFGTVTPADIFFSEVLNRARTNQQTPLTPTHTPRESSSVSLSLEERSVVVIDDSTCTSAIRKITQFLLENKVYVDADLIRTDGNKAPLHEKTTFMTRITSEERPLVFNQVRAIVNFMARIFHHKSPLIQIVPDADNKDPSGRLHGIRSVDFLIEMGGKRIKGQSLHIAQSLANGLTKYARSLKA